MADKTIRVREYTRPTIKVQLLDFRNEDDPRDEVDVASYEFDFTVKRDPTDTEPLFTVEGVPGTETEWERGIFYFYLTTAETSVPPGTYSGEICWWTDGGTESPPHDAWTVDFIVEPAYASLV